MPSCYTIKVEDMKTSMVPSIEKIVASFTKEEADIFGFFKVQIGNLPDTDWKTLSRRINLPEKEELMGFAYIKEREPPGFARVCGKKPATRFVFPQVWNVPARQTPSYSTIETYFQNVIDEPPTGNLPYYIGPPLLSPDLCPHIVDAGDRLRRRGRSGPIVGVNTNYWYLSGSEASPAPMHIEDAFLGSVNLLRGGDMKFWLFIPPNQRKAFEDRMMPFSAKPSHCSQAIRHQDRLVSPRVLREWGIKFYVDYCAAGEMMVTLPGTYHYIMNTGPSIAESVNFEFSYTPDMPVGYSWCEPGACTNGKVLTMDEFQLSEHICNPLNHSCFLYDLDRFPHLQSAFWDSHLNMARKARILQMIAACTRSLDRNLDVGQESLDNGFVHSVPDYLRQLQKAQDSSSGYTPDQRRALVAIAKIFQEEEKKVRKEMAITTRERKEMSKHGKAMGHYHQKGKGAPARVLENLLEQFPLDEHPRLMAQLKTYLSEGKTLDFMSNALGTNILAVLPEHTIRHCDIQFQFPKAQCCFVSLAQPIEPIW